MKRLYLLFILILPLLTPSVAHAAPTAGKPCSKVGQVAKVKAGKLVCIAGPGMPKWMKASPENLLTSVIEVATSITSLDRSLTSKLTTARTDKSPWLDQVCSVDFASTDLPVCEGGELTSNRLIVLYGDSHASMWMSTIDPIAKKAKYKVRLFAKLACPIVNQPVWSFQLNKPFDECITWQKLALTEIQNLKPEIIIVTDQWKPAVVDGKRSDFDTPFFWQREFPQALKQLAGLTKKIYVIGNNPSLTQDPVNCISRPRINLSLCSSGRTQSDNAVYNKIERDATLSVKGTYIDTVAWACTQTLCPVVIDKKIAYFDQWHFSETYVQYLLPMLQKSLRLG